MIKAIVLATVLVASLAAHEELKKCLQERCPAQYQKCLSTSGCEAKMDKCADKCGTQINKICWTTCIGLPGAAANLATCAANQGCVAVSLMDQLGDVLHVAQDILNADLDQVDFQGILGDIMDSVETQKFIRAE